VEVVIKQRQALTNDISFPDTIHPVLRRVYSNRGISRVTEVEHELSKLLPFTDLLGVTQAVAILYQALLSQKKIVVVGDYDADGATSTALVVKALRAFGAEKADFLIPNRFEYGYGLTPEIVALAEQRQAELLITVDNGIVSFDGVAAAKQKNMQVIITDHHLAAESLPNADAIVNPNQPNDGFGSKCLAGVGVSFYVMLALRAALREHGWFEQRGIAVPNMAQFLDIVALGTVADVVPLDQNNRILVEQGLQRIRSGQCCAGIKAILAVGKKELSKLVATDLGFIVGPRLNAAGRLDDMSLGVECLLTDNVVKAQLIAGQLDALNDERKHLEEEMREQAMVYLKKLHLESDTNHVGFCLYDPSWHQGIIGILAARVKDRYHRPVIAFANSGDHEVKGSARSIPGLHIRDILESVALHHPGLISKYGGHAMAAGLTLRLEQFEAFKLAFYQEIAKKTTAELLKNVMYTDGFLQSDDLTLQLAVLLKTAAPWGQHFPEPTFEGEFVLVEQRLVGEKHLKLIVASAEGVIVDAIAFNIDLQRWPNQRCQKVHLVYQLDVNEFRGVKQLQLIVRYIGVIHA